MTTAIGQFRHVVSLVAPGPGVEDPDGGWGGDAWVPLEPPTWHCSIQAASLRDLQRLSGGVLSTTATHVIRGRYHPQLTRNARIQFGDRVFDVESVHDHDERRIEVEVIAHEQLGAAVVAPPALPYADQVVADGAAHYWRLDDAGGTIAVDHVGFAHGTISAGVTLKQPGAIMSNAAMAFNGTTGKIVTTQTVAIPVIYTIEAWVTGNDAQDRPIFCPTATESPRFSVVDKKLNSYDQDNPTCSIGGTTTLTDGVWHHVVLVQEASGSKLYLDGVLDGSKAAPRTVPGNSTAGIGNDAAFGANPLGFWLGSLDEVAVYPLALSAAQVAAHYAARTGMP